MQATAIDNRIVSYPDPIRAENTSIGGANNNCTVDVLAQLLQLSFDFIYKLAR